MTNGQIRGIQCRTTRYGGMTAEFTRPCLAGDWLTLKPIANMTAKEKDAYLAAALRQWSRKDSGHEPLGIGEIEGEFRGLTYATNR